MIMFVCPSVRPSVTLVSVSHAETIQDIETFFAPTTEFSPNFYLNWPLIFSPTILAELFFSTFIDCQRYVERLSYKETLQQTFF